MIFKGKTLKGERKERAAEMRRQGWWFFFKILLTQRVSNFLEAN